MLPTKIKVVKPGLEAFLVKQKPQAIGQADIETLALRLGREPGECVTEILDDVLTDGSGGRHPARRLIVRHDPDAVEQVKKSKAALEADIEADRKKIAKMEKEARKNPPKAAPAVRVRAPSERE